MNDDVIKIDQHQFSECLRLAQDRLKSAKILLDESQYRDSISRSYYAFFDMVVSLLATQGIVTKTHRGALQQFSLYLVKSGLLPKAYGKKMRELLESRQEADYDWLAEFDQQDAIDAYNEARKFLDIVHQEIEVFFE